MKIFSTLSLSRKLIWCRDLIRHKLQGEAEQAEGCKDLPDDVMQVILQRLPLSDYLYCRDVSPSWRAKIESKRWLPAADQLPWLLMNNYSTKMETFYIKTDELVSDGKICKSKNNLTACFGYCAGAKMETVYIKRDAIFVSDRKICKSKNNRTDFYGYCAGAIEGWLVMVSERRDGNKFFFFFNPVSGAQVMLPGEPVDPNNKKQTTSLLRKVVASSIPTTSKCYATCIHFKESGTLAFCSPTYESWIVIDAEKDLKFFDIEILDGKLYAIGKNALEFVMVFDIHLDTHAYTSERLVTLQPNITTIVDDLVYHRTCHLAKCSESKDLFMILYQAYDVGRLFRVLKMENNNKWVEIADLGDRSLFMGTRNSMFITGRDDALGRNCINFVLLPGLGDDGYASGVFSLTDKSFKPITLPRQYQRIHHQTVWFTPNPC